MEESLCIVCRHDNGMFCTSKKEDAAEGIQKAEAYYADCLQKARKYKSLYDPEYWENRERHYAAVVKEGVEAVTWEEFLSRERERYLSIPLAETTAERYHEMFNILPPMYWTQDGVLDFEMFCVPEMISATYTSQYLHDLRTDRYYTKIVDSHDKKTWISAMIGEIRQKGANNE